MSEREYKRVTRQLKPFITLFIVVVGSAFLASCGGGSGSSDPTATVSSAEEPNVTAQAVSGSATVPGTWKGRVPPQILNPGPASLISDTSGKISGAVLLMVIEMNQIDAINSFIKSRGWTVVGQDDNVIQVNVGASSVDSLYAKRAVAEASGLFKYVAFDASLSTKTFNNRDPGWSDATKYWNYRSIRAQEAWDLVAGVTDAVRVRVGVPDEGFSLGQPYLKNFILDLKFADIKWPLPLSNCDAFTDTLSECEHGNHVAGIIGETGNDGQFGIGIGSGATNLVDIYAVNVSATGATVGSATNLDNKVINFSRGTAEFESGKKVASAEEILNATERAVDSANLIRYSFEYRLPARRALGRTVETVFVQASGNEGRITKSTGTKFNAELSGLFATYLWSAQTSPEYNYIADRTILVGSHGPNGEITDFTSLPSTLLLQSHFILAPGENIYSNTRWGIIPQSGTSMAAPHVSGVAALILEVNSNLNASDVVKIILTTADTKDGTKWRGPDDGYRYLNAEAAVKMALDMKAQKNCGTVSSPKIASQTGPEYFASVGLSEKFSVIPSQKGENAFVGYEWTTSEGYGISRTSPNAEIAFAKVGIATVTVTPVIKGVTCTLSAATTSVNVIQGPVPVMSIEMTEAGLAALNATVYDSGYTKFLTKSESGIGSPAMKFDFGGRIKIPSRQAFKYTEGLTVDAMIRVDTNTTHFGTIFAQSSYTDGYDLSVTASGYWDRNIRINGNSSFWGNGSNSCGYMRGTIPVGQWVRLTLVLGDYSYSGRNEVYINGVISSRCSTGGPIISAVSMRDFNIGGTGIIGGGDLPVAFAGAIAKVRLYNKPLSAADVFNLH